MPKANYGDLICVDLGLYKHFGLWCKTGVSKSYQVNLIVNLILLTIFFDFILNKKC